MKELEPYMNLEEALAALDNGGRFFNLFSHARDGKITASELKKAEGVISLFAGSFLYFEMMLGRLSSVAKETVIGALDSELREKYHKTKPSFLAARDLNTVSDSSTAVIVEGVPRFCSEQSKFSCFITVPVQTGSVTSSIMIPIHEQYSMYSLDEDASEIPIAVPQDCPRLAAESVQMGGFLQNASSTKSKDQSDAPYFSAQYLVRGQV